MIKTNVINLQQQYTPMLWGYYKTIFLPKVNMHIKYFYLRAVDDWPVKFYSTEAERASFMRKIL